MRMAAVAVAVGMLTWATTSVAGEPAIPVAPFTMSLVEHPDKVLEVTADGSVRDKASGKTFARFVQNELRSDKGETLLRVAGDGKVTASQTQVEKRDGKVVSQKTVERTLGKLSAKDELQSDQGGKIAVDDTGAIRIEPADKRPVPFKLTGVGPKNRRAAVLLVTSMIFGSRVESDVSSAHAEPATLAPTPPPAKK